MSTPRSQRQYAQATDSTRRAESLPAVRRARHTVTAYVSRSTPCSPRRCSPQPAAATVVQVGSLVEFVAAALDLDKRAHEEGIQHGPAAMRRCEPPAPEQSGALRDAVPRRTAVVGRSDSGLSACSTECGCDSPVLPQRIPRSKTPSAAPGTSSRNVRALAPHMLEERHVDARLRAVRPARRQKLQSSMD